MLSRAWYMATLPLQIWWNGMFRLLWMPLWRLVHMFHRRSDQAWTSYLLWLATSRYDSSFKACKMLNWFEWLDFTNRAQTFPYSARRLPSAANIGLRSVKRSSASPLAESRQSIVQCGQRCHDWPSKYRRCEGLIRRNCTVNTPGAKFWVFT